MRRNIYIKQALWEKVRKAAFRLTAKEQKRVSVSEVIRRALASYLGPKKRNGKPKPS